ncbi:hypothetical protein BY458DRAFT_478771 [Sporodiniella umbellata]|nr:hypothetical protein BY458DRAFT_478771 [Sporodiniella umbellata]
MQALDFSSLNTPFLNSSTLSEIEIKINKDEFFHKDLPTAIKQDVTHLIRYWSARCATMDRPQQEAKLEVNGFFEATADTNVIEPNSKESPLMTPTLEESDDDDFSSPATPVNMEIRETMLRDQTHVEFDSIVPSKPQEAFLVEKACEAVLPESPPVESVMIEEKSPEKSIKKSFSSFISKIKGVFHKKSKVGSMKSKSATSIKTISSKKKSTDKKSRQVQPEQKPLDLSDMRFVESIFERLEAPLTPNIKLVMERKLFFSVEELENEIVFWQEEKAGNNEFLARFGYSPWRPMIDARGDFYTEPGHGLERFDFCPFGSGLPTPRRLRISDSSFYFGPRTNNDDDADECGVSRNSFLAEFEARQRNGMFSYMDNYVEAPVSDCDDSSVESSSDLHLERFQVLDKENLDGGNKRSSGDQLLDEVWKQSEEYQEYLSNEAEDDEVDSYYGMPVRLVAGKRNVSSSIWNPPTANATHDGVRKHVAHSQTEVNIKTQDLVPYVKIDADTTKTAAIKEYRIPRKQIKHFVVDINDGALYKRSVSVYSSLKDYDLAWQKTFHDEQHDIDKVQATFQSISWALYNIIRQNHLEGNFYCDPVFLSPEITYDEDLWEAEPLTEWSDIFMEMAAIFERTDLTSEHAIIAFIYVQRMSETSGQCLFDGSWQYILMLSLLTAAKVWEDCSIYNSDYSQLFPDVSTKSM